MRKKAKIAQETLALDSGLSPRHFVRIENDKTVPSLETLERIAKGLDCKVSDIFLLAESLDAAP